MQFELTKEYLDDLREAIAEGRDRYLQEELDQLHPADIAEVFDRLKIGDATYLFKLTESEKAAEVMIELSESDREKLLATLTSREIATRVIDNIDSDDAADVLAELPEDKQAEVISHISDADQRSDISDLLRYPEDSAGGIMAKELVSVRRSWTIARGIREMRKQAEDLDQVYSIYVTDDEERLVGTLPLMKLLFSSSSVKTPIADIYDDEDLRYVFPETSGEDCSNMMEKYDMVALPVVDHDMKLLGRITIDDVVDFIKEEAERDYQLASGISEDVESHDTVWKHTRSRLPWLLIALIGGLLVSEVIGVFQDEIARISILALFMPLIAAMGGNVGVQSSAIVVKGLANKTLNTGSLVGKLFKELGIAMINGVICAVVLLLYSFFFVQSAALSFTVGISLLTVMMTAALFGTLVPLLLDKVNIDPALATGPFITTMNDILGMTVYFTYAKLFFHL